MFAVGRAGCHAGCSGTRCDTSHKMRMKHAPLFAQVMTQTLARIEEERIRGIAARKSASLRDFQANVRTRVAAITQMTSSAFADINQAAVERERQVMSRSTFQHRIRRNPEVITTYRWQHHSCLQAYITVVDPLPAMHRFMYTAGAGRRRQQVGLRGCDRITCCPIVTARPLQCIHPPASRRGQINDICRRNQSHQAI